MYSSPRCTALHDVQLSTMYSSPRCTALHDVQLSTMYSSPRCTALHDVHGATVWAIVDVGMAPCEETFIPRRVAAVADLTLRRVPSKSGDCCADPCALQKVIIRSENEFVL
jgi:hypothetical protein